MPTTLSFPVFCLTSDVDWASDDAVREFLALTSRYGIVPTIFATHPSQLLQDAQNGRTIDLGVHPNFLPGSSHGDDALSVIDHMCRLFPDATAFRAHAYFDNSVIATEMVRRGFTHDSNLGLYLQHNLVPLSHWSGLVRFPVFWEDDVHWMHTGGDWDVDRYLDDFLSPGLKIINVHPFSVAANIPNGDAYQSLKHRIATANADEIAAIRGEGAGVGTFLQQLLDALSARGERFYTLAELYHELVPNQLRPLADPAAGRQTEHTDKEHARYWTMSDQGRQELLRQDYEQRAATDPYATSRDVHLRELEIDSIQKQLGVKGRVLDLGCGNGYTLISLARNLTDWKMTGVDFSANLIAGAEALLEDAKSELRSTPQFMCADAIAYVEESEDDSIDYVITERFLINLPSKDHQREMLKQIYRILSPGGTLLMCEGEHEGFDQLNDLRENLGLLRVPATSKDNISPIRFNEQEVARLTSDIGFEHNDKLGYTTYFIISRVLHPLLSAPLAPRFDARINELARQIQQQLPYRPGYGSNVLWLLQKPRLTASDAADGQLHR